MLDVAAVRQVVFDRRGEVVVKLVKGVLGDGHASVDHHHCFAVGLILLRPKVVFEMDVIFLKNTFAFLLRRWGSCCFLVFLFYSFRYVSILFIYVVLAFTIAFPLV